MNPQQEADLRSKWTGITGEPPRQSHSDTPPPRASLRTRFRTFAVAMIDSARELVSGEAPSEAAPPPLRAPYSYTSPYSTEIQQGNVRSHVAPPSYPVVVEARREMLPINSVFYLCSECRVKHAPGGAGSIPRPYKVKKGETVTVTARPQRVAFRPENITIENADRWVVHDIKIGNRSQFAQSGDIPGSFFDARNNNSAIQFETAQTAMDVSFVVTYLGDEPDGEQFLATVTGTAAV